MIYNRVLAKLIECRQPTGECNKLASETRNFETSFLLDFSANKKKDMFDI